MFHCNLRSGEDYFIVFFNTNLLQNLLFVEGLRMYNKDFL